MEQFDDEFGPPLLDAPHVRLMLEVLLPRTEAGVAVQIIATILVGAIAVRLVILKGLNDLVWLIVGVPLLWAAFMAFRSLH